MKLVKEVTEQHKKPSVVARAHGVLSSILFSWRGLYARFGKQVFARVPSQVVLRAIEAKNEDLRKRLEQMLENDRLWTFGWFGSMAAQSDKAKSNSV